MANETTNETTIVLSNSSTGVTATGKQTINSALRATTSVSEAIETAANTANHLAKAGEYYARIAETNAATAHLEAKIENRAKIKALAKEYGLSEEEVAEMM